MIVGVLVSLAASLLGVTLVLKRFSFIGDGLSHVAFGAISIATVMHFTSYVQFTLPATILCAILILRTGRNSKINGDAVIAMLSVASLAVGYMIMNVFGASSNLSGDVCTTLFGSTSILTLSATEVRSTVILAIVVVGIFILFYNKLFAVTFDEDFARASGVHTEAYNMLIATVVAVVIVIAMDLVGSLLISALIIFPALFSHENIQKFQICNHLFRSSGGDLFADRDASFHYCRFTCRCHYCVHSNRDVRHLLGSGKRQFLKKLTENMKLRQSFVSCRSFLIS